MRRGLEEQSVCKVPTLLARFDSETKSVCLRRRDPKIVWQEPSLPFRTIAQKRLHSVRLPRHEGFDKKLPGSIEVYRIRESTALLSLRNDTYLATHRLAVPARDDSPRGDALSRSLIRPAIASLPQDSFPPFSAPLGQDPGPRRFAAPQRPRRPILGSRGTPPPFPSPAARRLTTAAG